MRNSLVSAAGESGCRWSMSDVSPFASRLPAGLARLRLAFAFSFPSVPRECSFTSLVLGVPGLLLVFSHHPPPPTHRQFWPGRQFWYDEQVFGLLCSRSYWTHHLASLPTFLPHPVLLLDLSLSSGRQDLDTVSQVRLWKRICHRDLFVQAYSLSWGNLAVISAADSWFGYFIHHSTFCHFRQLLLCRLSLSVWVTPFKTIHPNTQLHINADSHSHPIQMCGSPSGVGILVSWVSGSQGRKYLTLRVTFSSDGHDLHHFQFPFSSCFVPHLTRFLIQVSVFWRAFCFQDSAIPSLEKQRRKATPKNTTFTYESTKFHVKLKF